MKKTQLQIGGQALVEGVMMKAKNRYALAIRDPDGSIHTKTIAYTSVASKYKVDKIPFVRGIFMLLETMYIGTKTLIYSMDRNMSLLEEQQTTPTKKKKKEPKAFFSVAEIILTIFISIIFAILLLKVIPIFGAKFFTNLFFQETTNEGNILFNITDGLLRIAIFLGYLVAISFMPDIKRLFQYHGAEHKTVSAYENNKELTIKNVKEASRIHPRCGTTFIFIVLVLSIFVYIFIPKDLTIWAKLGLRILLLPAIAGVSYEIIKKASCNINNPLIKILIAPGLALQHITTKEPDDKQIEIGIASLKKALS